MCINYRVLNQKIIKTKYLILCIGELLDKLGGSVVFSKIDLRFGYWQISIHQASMEKTFFKTQEGHFAFMVIPCFLISFY